MAAEDRAWTTFGDSLGLHVLTAVAGEGYRWRQVATLTEVGFDVDQWIGHGCLTGDGHTVVVTYAPRIFTNRPQLFSRGGFVATVDLVTGSVKKLPVTSSLSYFTPACGAGDDAVVTQDGGEDHAATRLIRVDAGSGRVATPVTVAGQITSAVPTRTGFAAAGADAVLRIDNSGHTSVLAPANGVPFDLTVQADQSLVYLDRRGTTATAHRIDAGSQARARGHVSARTMATGPLDHSGATRTASGQVVLLDGMRADSALPAGISIEPAAAKDSVASTTGALLVERARPVTDQATSGGPAGPPGAPVRTLRIDAVSADTDRPVDLAVPASTQGVATVDQVSPVLRSSAAAPAGSRTSPIEAERTCSVARNDPKNQAMQPKPRQVEWAVDQAVRSSLTVSRPANWKNLGMPAYTPQGLFPSKSLAGGGTVPAQLVLGILAQESNLWQAPGNVTPGVTGNPLIGNFYGLQIYDSYTADDWNVNWDLADCGYGVAQVTDGMRLAGKQKTGEVPFAYQTQRAVALDFATNIAAGLRILQDKWNQVSAAGLVVNNGDPKYLENWFYAVWAYNTGFHPQSEAGANNGAWGLGWANNPANPIYPANRSAFLDTSYADAAHPEDWPYPEKVLGFAGHPIDLLESPGTYVSAYRAAWWPGLLDSDAAKNRREVKPPVDQFCDLTDQCFPGLHFTGTASEVYGANAGPCAHKNAAGQYDLKCWYHQSSRWKSDCPSTCGQEFIRFVPGYEYQADGNPYPPSCSTAGLPAGALIIDDQPDSYAAVRPGCTRGYTGQGTFSLVFGNDSGGYYPSKTDFHQLGAGFNGHFWYAHTRTKDVRGDSMRVTGTWTLNKKLTQWARVMVHVPDIGAWTQEAAYTVNLGNGTSRTRIILQRRQANSWLSLGVFPFAGTPSVSLSSTTREGDGPGQAVNRSEDIAYDAVAFQPLSAKPRDVIVSLGDSYSSGEGSSSVDGADFYAETDTAGVGFGTQNLCHRSRLAWSRQATLTGATTTIGAASDAWNTTVEHDLLACSGAESENILAAYTSQPTVQNAFGDPNHGQYREPSQLDRGFVDQDTTLVTLSVGGNDARFAEVIKHCIDPRVTLECQYTNLSNSSVPASQEIPARITGPVAASVRTVLDQIHRKAPSAKIVLMGYPHVIEPGRTCSDAPLIDAGESTWIGSMSDLMDQTLARTVTDFNTATKATWAVFADPRADFNGHGVCTAVPGIRGVTNPSTPAEDILKVASNQSFHPNAAGQKFYATALNRALRQLGR